MNSTTAIGFLAAFCTTVSYVPQIKKCWETGEAGDLSLWMFCVLTAGIGLWVVYGSLIGDAVVITANSVSLCFLAIILFFKLREMRGPRRIAAKVGATVNTTPGRRAKKNPA